MSPLQLIIQILKQDFNLGFPDRKQAGPEEQGDDQGEEASSGSRDFMLKDGYVKRDGERDGGSRWEDGEVNIGDLETMTKGRNSREDNTPQVWPLTQFFLFPLCDSSLICLEGKSMTLHRGNTILFRSSQQFPHLRLGPLRGFLS